VHTFAKEWVAMGHQVRVVHNIVSFPRILYFFASFFKEFIASKLGTKINFKKVKSDSRYVIDGIEVFRFPMFKFLPHGRYAKKQIENQLKKIKLANEIDGFIPDVIIGHWTNPQIELMPTLKKVYNSKSCLIFHDKATDFNIKYKEEGKLLLDSFDVIGYRSTVIKSHIEKQIKVFPKSFICYSGLTDIFFNNRKVKKIKEDIVNYVFIGDFFARKNPSILLLALAKAYKNITFNIDYVGNGYEQKKIVTTAKKLKKLSNIKFHGQLSHEQIKNVLFDTDCFIMLSKNETLGLVYLEAMAMGCITICSKNEGIDGIIVNGVNGFLCEEGNVVELAELINTIRQLSIEERRQISNNAIATMSSFSTLEVAKKYLEQII
jgi:glycosyltransferase involved in cell wall biosynthesis